MTSPARASSVGGRMRPSVFAVLRLIPSLVFGRRLNWKISRASGRPPFDQRGWATPSCSLHLLPPAGSPIHAQRDHRTSVRHRRAFDIRDRELLVGLALIVAGEMRSMLKQGCMHVGI